MNNKILSNKVNIRKSANPLIKFDNGLDIDKRIKKIINSNSSSYVFENGITLDGSNVSLGGDLINDVLINGQEKSFELSDIDNLEATSATLSLESLDHVGSGVNVESGLYINQGTLPNNIGSGFAGSTVFTKSIDDSNAFAEMGVHTDNDDKPIFYAISTDGTDSDYTRIEGIGDSYSISQSSSTGHTTKLILNNGQPSFIVTTSNSTNTSSIDLQPDELVITLPENSIVNIEGLPVYDSEAAANTAGLDTNDVYRTSTGELRIKL